VKAGTRVFLWWSTECSSAERDTRFFAIGEDAQAACARALDEAFVRSVVVNLDGRTIEIRRPRFEVVTEQRTVHLPANNILSGVAGRATFVAHGWVLLTRPLRPGHHVFMVTTTTSDGELLARYEIDVLRRDDGDDDDDDD
jgi:hypothetical protein